MRKEPSKTAFIVSHTHWDREWYHTYHRFRVNLVRVVQQVLEVLETDPDFGHFLLDGQAIALEDYLAIRPQDEDRIKQLVEQGKLSIGPWYVLPDEFLVSGEATVRNLLVGHRVAGRVGPVQKVGYMPDSFGHIAQLPQILQRAGLDSFVYTRGNGDEIDDLGLEYMWVAPDGSEVIAINQHRGYCNAGALGFEESWHALTPREVDPARAVERVGTLLQEMAQRSQGDVYLINNGCDHLPPQRDLGAIVRALVEAFPEVEFRNASLEEYVQAVRTGGFARRRYAGELLSGKQHFILSGVWSTRTYLKQMNDEAQVLLSAYLEPVSAYTHFAFGLPYPHGLIDDVWKLLLTNHPHDSICGCSTDDVHREMLPRFQGVIDSADESLRTQLEQLMPRLTPTETDSAAAALCVMNPLPEARTEIVERLLVLPSDVDVSRLQLVNGEGSRVPFGVVSTDYVERFWGIDYHRTLLGEQQLQRFEVYREQLARRVSDAAVDRAASDCLVTIQFVATLPALGHATYELRANDGGVGTAPPPALTDGASTLENEHVRVSVYGNGSFDLFDKTTGQTFAGLNRFEDTEDIGDEYDFCPSEESRTITADGIAGTVRVLDDSGFCARVEATCVLPLPVSIDRDRTRRADELVGCAVRVRVGLCQFSPRVDVDVFFDNRAKDHRLRTTFPTSIQTETIASDGHFYINHRSVDSPEGSEWLQPPSGTYPQQEFSLVQDGERGLAVLNRGLPEIAPLRQDDGSVGLALTLVRAVGWLSRDDFPTRRYRNAGPTLATAEAQCLGEQRLRYAVLPFGGDYISADIKAQSARYRTPVVAVQGVMDRRPDDGVALLRKETHLTAISAVKKHEVRDTLVVRLYNLVSEQVDETVSFARAIRAAWRVDLLEERLDELPVTGAQLPIGFGPHEIVTVEVELGDGE